MTSEAVLLIVIAVVFLLAAIFSKYLVPRIPGRSRPQYAMRPTARVALFVLSGVFLLLGISRLLTS